MLDTFKKYCHSTMEEIYEASLLPVPKGKHVAYVTLVVILSVGVIIIFTFIATLVLFCSTWVDYVIFYCIFYLHITHHSTYFLSRTVLTHHITSHTILHITSHSILTHHILYLNITYRAYITSRTPGKPPVGGPLNAEKLRAKVVQFFPNVVLTVEEINMMPTVRFYVLIMRGM